MKISPKYRVSDFTKAHSDGSWDTLVNIFSDRLEGRYLKPIELILTGDCEINEFSGFSILALDCILIETLSQFDKGIEDTPFRQGKLSFVSFLTTKNDFKDNFDDATAETFYDHFRNGLLHQAQTKEKSLIKINQSKMVTKITDGLIIDRLKFHDALKNEIESYKQHLLKDELNLRPNFILKMKHICNIAQA